jgi:hypothetical protein
MIALADFTFCVCLTPHPQQRYLGLEFSFCDTFFANHKREIFLNEHTVLPWHSRLNLRYYQVLSKLISRERSNKHCSEF